MCWISVSVPVSLHTVNLSTLVNAAVVVGVEEDETVIVMFLRQINYGIVISIRLTT